jgi:hypothetical protein
MSITYTNRKGVTLYLCRSVIKTGKPRYYFAREQKGEPVEAIPEGYRVGESVNGLVFLEKDRPMLIRPEEVTVVEAAIARHRKPGNYRVRVKHDRIEIYERVGPDADDLISAWGEIGPLMPGLDQRIRDEIEQHGRFTPVLRFILDDEARRTFRAERWCYLGSIDDWIDIGSPGPLDRLARQMVPKLGTEAFFELM